MIFSVGAADSPRINTTINSSNIIIDSIEMWLRLILESLLIPLIEIEWIFILNQKSYVSAYHPIKYKAIRRECLVNLGQLLLWHSLTRRCSGALISIGMMDLLNMNR